MFAYTREIANVYMCIYSVTDDLTCESVCGRFYLHVERGNERGRRGGWMAGSFVECGLILMGTDDKQRKQASSLPGEICLLLPACSGAIHGNVAQTTMTHPLSLISLCPCYKTPVLPLYLFLHHLNDHRASTQTPAV